MYACPRRLQKCCAKIQPQSAGQPRFNASKDEVRGERRHTCVRCLLDGVARFERPRVHRASAEEDVVGEAKEKGGLLDNLKDRMLDWGRGGIWKRVEV